MVVTRHIIGSFAGCEYFCISTIRQTSFFLLNFNRVLHLCWVQTNSAAGLGKGQALVSAAWGDLDQMVSSVLQMHFTFPSMLLAHCRTRADRALSPVLCGYNTCSGLWSSLADQHPPTASSSSTQMLYHCTAPANENQTWPYPWRGSLQELES